MDLQGNASKILALEDLGS